MTMQDDATSSVNDSGTNSKSGTRLTQSCSPDVLRDLLVKRNRIGAETPLGNLLSNLIQQIRNYQREEDPVARANLERFMGWTVDAIQRTA